MELDERHTLEPGAAADIMLGRVGREVATPPPAPAPAAAPAAATEAAEPVASVSPESIEILNRTLMELVEKVGDMPTAAGEAARTAAAAPDPLQALMDDPEVPAELKAIAGAVRSLTEKVGNIETMSIAQRERAENARIENEALATAKKFGMTQAELNAVYDRWGHDVKTQDERLAVLTFEEYVRRVVDPKVLDAREAAARASAPAPNGAPGKGPEPAPRNGGRPPGLAPSSATGGGAPTRAVISGDMSNEDIGKRALREVFGIEPRH